jgi:hypothetical protein
MSTRRWTSGAPGSRRAALAGFPPVEIGLLAAPFEIPVCTTGGNTATKIDKLNSAIGRRTSSVG